MKKEDINSFEFDQESCVVVSDTESGPTAFIGLGAIGGMVCFRGPTPIIRLDPIVERLRSNYPPNNL
jgi:hypothetical protein